MFQFLLVHVLVTDGRFSVPEVNQLHQDLEGVDGHRFSQVFGINQID